MVVVLNRGGIFCHPGPENNGGAVSIAQNVSEDFCFVETNRKMARDEGHRVEFLEEDYAIALAEKV